MFACRSSLRTSKAPTGHLSTENDSVQRGLGAEQTQIRQYHCMYPHSTYLSLATHISSDSVRNSGSVSLVEATRLSSTTKSLHMPNNTNNTSFSNNSNKNSNANINTPNTAPTINHLVHPLSPPLVLLDIPPNPVASPCFHSLRTGVTMSLGGLQCRCRPWEEWADVQQYPWSVVGQLQRSQETGVELYHLTGVMNDMHHTLSRSLVHFFKKKN
jgi:hypothetical protein